MIDSPDSLLVNVSRSKNIEGKKLKKEEPENWQKKDTLNSRGHGEPKSGPWDL